MASVSAVYNTLKDLVNKDQNGFVTPTVFNNFAQIAQLRIFNRLFDELKDAKRMSKAGFNPGRDKSRFKRIEEDLAYFSRVATTAKVGDIFPKPDDLARLIGITTSATPRVNVEMCYDEDKIDRILISNISAPTADFPVALVNEDIEVFPSTIANIRVKYYKYPQGIDNTGVASVSPPTVVVDANDTPTSTCVDFELPDHYLNELVIEMGQLIGVNLRDQVVSQATQLEQNERKQESTF
jgi:hypothetical protein